LQNGLIVSGNLDVLNLNRKDSSAGTLGCIWGMQRANYR